MKNIILNDFKKTVGLRIRKLRTDRNISTEELAEQLELSPAFIGLIERGQRGASVVNIVKMSMLFDVSVDYILGLNKESDEKISRFATINFLMDDFQDKEINFFTEVMRGYRALKRKDDVILGK